MIETIRKHSKWLLWVIAGLTIASFVFFMGSGPARYGAGGSQAINTNLVGGTIYGEKVTQGMYDKMKNDVDLYFLFNYGQWPNRNNVSENSILQQIYVRMMLVQKADALGIHVSDEQVMTAAADMLRSPALLRALDVRGQSVPLSTFVNQVLNPQSLSEEDFFNYVRDDLKVEQLQNIYGMTGQLVTPQEATNEYVREYQEYSTEAVFFSASNYLAETSVTPDDVGQYYTNFMADYRLPDRVQVSYVVFSVSNHLAEAKQQSTNLDAQTEGVYGKYGMELTPDAKTADEAKAEIRQMLIRQQALQDADRQANDFAQTVYNLSTNGTASAADLLTVARQRGVPVQTTAPFSADYGPQEFAAPAAFTRTAFELAQTPESPISEPVVGPNGVYVMALDKFLPSEIPPLPQIRARVTEDLRLREATVLARRAGTNFVRKLTVQMAAGKSFAAACIAAGAEPQVLPPVALSTSELPELGGRATLNQIKEAAITTPVGATSGFKETDDGGFLLYVESQLPIDESKMAAEMPEFTAELRQHSAQAAFSEWLNREASRELRDTPLPRALGMR